MKSRRYKHIYKQFVDDEHVLNLEQMQDKSEGIQWFALVPNYGESYGPISHKYKVIKSPRLINLGKNSVRQKIITKLLPNVSNIKFLIDPDEQYWRKW
jgi:hypothetical protein